MAAQSYEFTGKTTDEAIADGLKTLKLRQDQVDIEVLNKGSRGIFGIGSELARVRLTVHSTGAEEQEVKAATPAVAAPPTEQTGAKATVSPVLPTDKAEAPSIAQKSQPEATPTMPTATHEPEPSITIVEPAVSTPSSATDPGVAVLPAVATPDVTTDEVLPQLAVELLTKMIQLMGFQCKVSATWQTGDDKAGEYEETYLLLNIHGDDLGALIGRRGETLDNIQYLLRLMINQRLRQWKNIVVDVEQYKARRLTQLTQLALRMAEQVTTSGRSVSLEPMPPNERRVVHLALRDHPTVYTESTGDGERRKVNIVAK
jgi:spoIIIJ-associated protein